jgi:2-dehydropantoate 2-reductase
MARVAVVGAGSIGACFAAHLSVTDHDVVACVRRRFDHYVIESETTPVRAPASVVTDPGNLDGPVDWVLVGVKAHQTKDAAPWFDALCGPETVVVALQNGVEAVERLSSLVHGAEVVQGVVYCGAELLGPGHVLHTTRNLLIVPDTPAGEGLRALYEDTPVEIAVDRNHLRKAWLKLSTNVVGNGLTALTRRPLGVMAEPPLFPVATAMMAETWAVANAEGAQIDASDPGGYVRAITDGNPDGRTSMLMDTEAGRRTEHDAIHGAVLRAADRHGIPVPTVRAVHGILDTRAV